MSTILKINTQHLYSRQKQIVNYFRLDHLNQEESDAIITLCSTFFLHDHKLIFINTIKHTNDTDQSKPKYNFHKSL